MKIRVTQSRYWYKAGEVYTLLDEKADRDGDYRVEHPKNSESTTYLVRSVDCEVITNTAQEDASLLVLARKINEQATKISAQAVQIDGLADAVAKLTRKVSELGRDNMLIGAEELPSYISVASGPVSNALPSFANRDDVIAKAKRDVAELAAGRHDNVLALTGNRVGYDSEGYGDAVKYVVSREKRTVVALLTDSCGKHVWARGIAKAAPGECFNVHIGRAISLRRALGLEVPTEYTNAPAPREPHVGDIVALTCNSKRVYTIANTLPEKDGYYGNESKAYRFTEGGFDCASHFVIIDDSREEVTQ